MPRTPPTPQSIATGRRVRELRQRADEGQMELAVAVDVSRPTISGIETGAAMPGRETMARIARHYGVSVDYLESGSVAPSNDIPGESIKDASEASLVRFWRILERDQKDELMARIADMIGSRLPATPEPDNSPHRRTPLRSNEP